MIIPGFKGLDKDNCVLNEHCIDLWQFSLAEELANANELLNAEEQARAARFYFQRHQRRFATGRATLRMILARYLNTPPECLQFSYNAHGKPTVMNAASLEFNLSHTEDLALLAIGKKHPLGVDIEKYTARPYEGIAKSLFSDQEFKAFIKTPHVLKPAVFFHVWSQKEAFIKACGLGLAYPTKEFNVPTVIPTHQSVYDPVNDRTWQLRSFIPEMGYSGALCYHPTIATIRYGILPKTTPPDF